MYTYCTACHIVPFSRPDVRQIGKKTNEVITSQIYQEVLGITRDPPMFKASVGLLLRDDLHHAYDRLEWSLYYRASHPRCTIRRSRDIDANRTEYSMFTSSYWDILMPRVCMGWLWAPAGFVGRLAKCLTGDWFSGTIGNVYRLIFGGFRLGWGNWVGSGDRSSHGRHAVCSVQRTSRREAPAPSDPRAVVRFSMFANPQLVTI